jgi:hypothetical protein
MALGVSGLRAQQRITDHNAHGWFNYYGNHQLGQSRWGIYAEGQWRRHDIVTQWQQLLLRPGVNFDVNKYLTLTTGYAFIRTYRYGDFPAAAAKNNEQRLWHQGLLRYKTGDISWTSRVRLENRFLSSRYENRIRLWQQARIPLSQNYYLNAYEEAWFYMKPYVASSLFDQNRAFVGLGRTITPALRIEAGYLNQTILQRSGSVLEVNHTLMISLYGNGRISRR